MGKHKQHCCIWSMAVAAAAIRSLLMAIVWSMMVSEAFVPCVFGNEEEDGWMGGATHCGVTQLQGRRSHQEDRVICMPELLLVPGLGGCSDHGLHVGLFGVFDGHNGAEASEFASSQLPHQLRHHTSSIVKLESKQGFGGVCLDSSPLGSDFSLHEGMHGLWSGTDEKRIDGKCEQTQSSFPLYRAILKEALLRALSDIDSALSNKSGKQSGSTAVVVLKLDNHLLVGNIGDSKAFVCSLSTEADPAKSNASISTAWDGEDGERVTIVQELTVDHHPDRVDERIRIEAAGGFVSTWGGVPRVNGQLAISRAIGDAAFKKFGVIAEPEFFEWHEFSSADSFLIITSDGIFERLVPQDICNLVLDEYRKFLSSTLVNKSADATSASKTIADAIVKAAYKSGSYDNLAAVVYPLNTSPQQLQLQRRGVDASISRVCHNSDREAADLMASHDTSSCYELIEKVPTGVVLPVENSGVVMGRKSETKGPLEYLYGQSTGWRGKLEVYHEHRICLRKPVLSNEEEVCLNPETFSTYLRLIEAVPVLEKSFPHANVSDKVNSMDANAFYSYTSFHKRYILTKNIARGGFGEVWFATSKSCFNAENTDKALGLKNVFNVPLKSEHLKSEALVHRLTKSITVSTKTNSDIQQDLFVLKRILVEKGNEVYLSGIREKHFGELFLNSRKLRNVRTDSTHERKPQAAEDDGLSHIARYVESFEDNIEGNFWLVFVNEGYPLSSMLYTADTTIEENHSHVRVLEPSSWWKWLKTTKEGEREMRNLLLQLILGVKACHDRNITHRDIKPENMMVRATSRCSVSGETIQLHEELPCNLSMRIIDFGSAVDSHSLQNLYGPLGPSRHEQTEEYTPPESLLQSNWLKIYRRDSTKYDLWSIGIVMLELVLGTPHVFQIAARTRALLDQQLEGWGSSALNTAYMLRALMEMCILYPGKSGHHRPANMDNLNLASWTCTEENLMLQIKERDPLGIGIQDVWALRLLRGLLQWHPEDRITVEEALRHPYFHPSIQGREDEKM